MCLNQQLKQKSLELQIAELKIKQHEEKLAQEQSQMKLYAEQVSQLLATEKNLRLQLTTDGEKFQQFHVCFFSFLFHVTIWLFYYNVYIICIIVLFVYCNLQHCFGGKLFSSFSFVDIYKLLWPCVLKHALNFRKHWQRARMHLKHLNKRLRR